MTSKVVLDFDTTALAALRKGPKEFAEEVKTAAVVEWYAEGRVSQSKAAEILGMSREAFLVELFMRKGLDHLQEVRQRFLEITDRFADSQA